MNDKELNLVFDAWCMQQVRCADPDEAARRGFIAGFRLKETLIGQHYAALRILGKVMRGEEVVPHE